MPYARKYAARKPSTRKYARKTYRKSSALDKKIATISKQVALRQAETKHVFFDLTPTPLSLYHNTLIRIQTENMCKTSQGVGDGDSSGNINARIGDEVHPRGIKIYLTVRQPNNKPNVMFRFMVLKTRGSSNSTTLPFKDITGVKVIDPVDNEKSQGRIIMNKLFKDRSMSYSRHDNTATHNSELTFVRQYWIPLSGVYKYDGDNAAFGRDYNLVPFMVAYDSFGTLTTDVVASVKMSYQFYFKDM